ncbi:uroporphyrinogen-III C-methyltransferase [Candidatus Enterovibrio altilux]|uniref:Uroporphyrinogen-III methyltransferase n=1 Tax=Candidatus Enterovibrio altilux TaxID=1927128 RepID=A0A291B8C5_9GAMM|nr:uroporphyrinogen-III C-methyltransferase [Candidatus Enterovibrio luxaltus]ATF09250.1 Uroporphyrinogen-III methyltransferase [Candidatus Enterovibrio luxaltus]
MTDKNKTLGTDKDTSPPASSIDKEPIAVSSTTAKKSFNASTSSGKASSCSASKSTKPTQTEKHIGNKLTTVALILAIMLNVGLYYYNYQHSKQYSGEIFALTTQVEALKTTLTDNKQQNQNALQSVTQNTQVLINQQNQTILSLQFALADMQGRQPNDWLLAEAEHLVNQAGHQLWLLHDVLTAIILMETADQRIATLNDPSLTSIRQAITKDIMQLKTVKHIDRDGIVLRLNSLQQEVDKLPLINMPKAAAVGLQTVSTDVNDWAQNFKISINNFVSQFITYHKRDGNIVPLLTSAQTFYLQENLKTKLDQAITAVYRENSHLYSESINTAKAWVERFYNQDIKLTAAFLTTLTHLGEQTISVNYPKVLHSQKMISEILADRLRRYLPPLPAENSSTETQLTEE